jgi:maleate isomerase
MGVPLDQFEQGFAAMDDSQLASPAVRREIPFETDSGVASRAALGLIVLASDQTLEYEFRRIAGLPGVGIYESRIYNAPQTTPETLRAMEKDIAGGAGLILPGLPLSVMAFGCTSATMLLGEDVVFGHIRSAHPDVACTSPITGALAALDYLEARRIAILTPYRDDINVAVAQYIEDRGLQVVSFGSFNEDNDHRVARTAPQSIRQAVLAVGSDPSVDAVFVCCTSLRLVDQVQAIEMELKKPVTSSNHAMAWHALRLAGVNEPLPQFGRLFEFALPAR